MRRIRAIAALSAAAAVAAAAPAATSADAEGGRDIVETAAAAGKFDTLTSLLRKAGLARTLKRPGPYTVFAPTDRAFSKVPDSTLDALAEDREKLRAVLLYHVAKRRLTADKVVRRRSIKTLNGKRVRVRVRGDKVRVGGARVTTADVAASNGVIHVINRVLIPR
jgi:uncharacterized surface protein with fasciclin (FAS1) repeats